MVYDTIENIELYKGLGERIYKALTLLRDTDFSKLEAGKHPIDGDNLFMSVQSYTTKLREDAYCEAHKKYIDIQYMISGSEYIGVAPLDAMGTERTEMSRPEGDIWFYNGDFMPIYMTKGRFAIFYPNDAHAPAIADGDPAPAQKVIMKIAI